MTGIPRYRIRAARVAQEFAVSETTTVPWPKAPSARLDMALPGSRIERNVLLTWFGDEANPVLRLRPIVLCPEDTRP